MKVICIDNDSDYFAERMKKWGHYFEERLTLGKFYDVLLENKIEYLITDDLGTIRYFYKDKFITIEEFRNNKIEEILG
jgi:hypothetical protein